MMSRRRSLSCSKTSMFVFNDISNKAKLTVHWPNLILFLIIVTFIHLSSKILLNHFPLKHLRSRYMQQIHIIPLLLVCPFLNMMIIKI